MTTTAVTADAIGYATEAALASDAEATLLADLRAGGERRRKAIDLVFSEYAGRIVGYYRSCGASQAQAEDWLQDCFIRLLQSIDAFRGESKFSSWLWTIARNIMLDGIRREGVQARVEVTGDDGWELVEDPTPAGPAIVEATEFRNCVRRGIDEFIRDFPERAQCVSWLVSDGLPISEIAQILGRTPGATREYLSQCRKKLRPYLERCFAMVDESKPQP